MNKLKRIIKLSICSILSLQMLVGCTAVTLNKNNITDKTPTTIVLWHYYNGPLKIAFDNIVDEFNSTVGIEKGIVVDSYSQGDVNELADAVLGAANNDIGSEPMPNIFAAYSDNVYRVDKVSPVVNLDDYFTADEISQYRPDFIEDGRFGKDNALKIIPVAKSTENLYVNITDWNKFANETNADIGQLSTWEGLASTAKSYHEWTDSKTPQPNDGKALLGIDSMANFIIISSMQLGQEIYSVNDGNENFNFDKNIARKIWDSFYIPFINGHYAAIGRFRSDDAKIGVVLSYIGSTAGSAYFPKEVTLNQKEIYPIECKVLPYPIFESSKPYAIQQGAGMVISKSDKKHEEASAIFLKWFTDTEQNVKFAVSTGYMPVKNKSLDYDLITSELNKNESTMENQAALESIVVTQNMIKSYSLYGNKPFNGSYEGRKILETSLLQYAKDDLKAVTLMLEQGINKQEAISKINIDMKFEMWYDSLVEEISSLVK